MGHSCADPLRFYTELQERASLDGCAALFRQAIAPFGFVAFACGEIDLSDRERNVMFIAEWPEEWKRYYFESGFVHRDPVLNALNLYRKPFTFCEIVRDPRFSSMERQLLRAAAEHGWSQGLVVPVARGGTRFGLVSLVGRGPQVEGADRSRLCLMSECLLTRVRALVQTGASALAPASLTAREIEALRLVVVGCSDSEIASSLGISESTAHKHVESARRRLKAKSRAQMAALGVSFAIAPVTASTGSAQNAAMAYSGHLQPPRAVQL